MNRLSDALVLSVKELFGNNFVICIEQGLNTSVRRRQGMLVFQL